MDVSVIVCVLTLDFIVVICKTEKKLICQDKTEEIKCGPLEKIEIQAIDQETRYDQRCPYESTQCTENFSNVVTKCNGNNSCTVDGNDLTNSICYRYPRYTALQYTCSYSGFYYIYYQNWEKVICTSRGGLPSCNWPFKISSTKVKTSSTIAWCDRPLEDITSCIQFELEQMCLGRQHCYNKKEFYTCLYLPLSFRINYRCVRDNSRINGSFLTPKIVIEGEPKEINFTDTILTVKNAARIITVFLDDDKRLLGYNSVKNVTYSLCSYGWKDVGASVACRHLNMSYYGKSGSISRNNVYERFPVVLYCAENATSLMECSPILNETISDACESLGDATVFCHDFESGIPEDCGEGSYPETGLVVGIIIGCFLLFAVAVLVLRYVYKGKKTGSSNNSNNEHPVIYNTSRTPDNAYVYTEVEEDIQRDASEPLNSVSKSDANSYFILDPKVTGFNKAIGKQQDRSKDHYASSVEGVYDVTNDNRHVDQDNTNVYSHTFDDVYDITNANRHADKDDTNVYSHTIDDVYDVSGKNRKQDSDVDDY